jgi:group I intron endonuclease
LIYFKYGGEMIIYKATNLINGKVYIGQTIQTLKKRRWKHLSASRNKKFTWHFYKSIRKYGENNFKWEIIDRANNIDDLNKKEEYWIKYYNSIDEDYGYNKTYGGNNKRMLKSVKDKISKSNIGKIRTKEHCKNISKNKKGLKMSENQKKKISNTLKGRKFSKEHIRKKIMAQTGEKNPCAKLTKKDIVKIKTMINSNIPDPQIAKYFNCTYKNIWLIRHEKTWRHIKI